MINSKKTNIAATEKQREGTKIKRNSSKRVSRRG